MSKLKLDILSKKGNIYYTDTDSIVCDIQLDNNIVDPNLLGKLKLEHIVKKGIFISGKTYLLVLNEIDKDTQKNKTVKRAKGVKAKFLKESDYENLLNNINVETAIKTTSSVD